MATYTVTVKALVAKGGTTKIADAECARLDYGKALEGTGSCTFDLPMEMPGVDRNNLEPDQSEVTINRNGTPVWGGHHYHSAIDWEQGIVTFSCENWFKRLETWLPLDDLFFNEVDQFEIVRRLITYVQTGAIPGSSGFAKYSQNFGITVQAGNSGITRKRAFCCPPTESIADIIRDLAEHYNGFDFEITPTRTFSMWNPRRGSDLALTFNYDVNPDQTTNVWGIANHEIDGEDRRTLIAALPPDKGCWDCDDMLLVVPTSGPDAEAPGVMMETMDTSNIKDKRSRQQRARERLRILKHNRAQLTITTPLLPFGNYEVGDSCFINAHRGYIQWGSLPQERHRIDDWHVTVQGGNEVADVTLSWPKDEAP
jgi:hypothetical protein